MTARQVAAQAARRFALFEIVAAIEHDCLNFQIVYPTDSKHQDRIGSWIAGYQDALERLVDQLQDVRGRKRSPTCLWAFNRTTTLLRFVIISSRASVLLMPR